MKTPRALIEYRNLPPAERATFNPSGRPGADTIRRLQWIAQRLPAARDPARRTSALEWIRNKLHRPEPALDRDIEQRHYVVPLTSCDAMACTRIAEAIHPRRRNWRDAQAVAHPTRPGDVTYEPFMYRGRAQWYGVWYHPIMQCVARISRDGSLLGAIIGHTDETHTPNRYVIRAGRGYRWHGDDEGVRLVRLADGVDYRPTSSDIRAGRKAIIAALRERAEIQKRERANARKQQRVLAAACRHGIWVSFLDARIAGNCRSGIEKYAQQHGLDLHRHYRVDRLPATSRKIQRRIELAAKVAQRRQANEQAVGYCELPY